MSKKKSTAPRRSEQDRYAAKKDAFGPETTSVRGRRYLIPAAVAASLLLAAGLLFGGVFGGKTPDPIPAETSSAPTSSQQQITYAVADFDDGKARYYDLEAGNGITVRYFILKSSDGVIRAAFDACDVCWPAGRGYAQDGDVMVCRNCGRRFASININDVKGGCNPAPLNRRVENGEVVITAADILEGQGHFNLPKRS